MSSISEREKFKSQSYTLRNALHFYASFSVNLVIKELSVPLKYDSFIKVGHDHIPTHPLQIYLYKTA